MTSSLQNGEYYDFKIGQLNSLRCHTGRDGNNFLSWIFRYWFWTKLHKESWANDYTSGELLLMVLVTIFRWWVLVILFFSIGLLALEKFFRRSIANKISTIAIQYSDFEEWSYGCFWCWGNLFFGTCHKLTLNYQNRPVYQLILLAN
jgi:hypothetical protein